MDIFWGTSFSIFSVAFGILIFSEALPCFLFIGVPIEMYGYKINTDLAAVEQDLKEIVIFKAYWNKLDGVALLIAEPPPANSTTMHSRMVWQDRNACLGGRGSAYENIGKQSAFENIIVGVPLKI